MLRTSFENITSTYPTKATTTTTQQQ